MVGEGSGAGLTDAEVMLGAVTDRAIVMSDSDGGLFAGGGRAPSITGLSDQEVTGKPHLDIPPPSAGLATRELAQAREHHRRVRGAGGYARAAIISGPMWR